MRLTGDLIRQAPAYMNALKDRELGLRGYKIPTIENLGVTGDQYQTLDLSDNDILKLDNFPLMTRVETLLLNNNKIVRIRKGLGEFLPKLSTLILTNNRIASLKDLLPLRGITTLTHVSLLKNPVATVENYRLYVIHKLPKLRVLDFVKVTPKERAKAFEVFGKPKWALKKGEKLEVKEEEDEDEDMEAEPQFTVAETEPTHDKPKSIQATPEQRQKIMDKIKTATSLSEIESLEKMLKSGQIPAGFLLE
jgi:U2 small nuclear ribonucleoprotein A'